MSASRVEARGGTTLHGMKAICAHMQKSEVTVRKLIRADGLPAVKEGGEWISDTGAIQDWRLERMRNNT